MFRLAWLSSLEKNCTSYASLFTRTIASECQEGWDIEFFSTTDSLESLSISSKEVKPYHMAFMEHQKKNFDAYVLCIEDSKSSEFIRSSLPTCPGVVYFFNTVFKTLSVELPTLDEKPELKDYEPTMDEILLNRWQYTPLSPVFEQGTEIFSDTVIAASFNEIACHVLKSRAPELNFFRTTFPLSANLERFELANSEVRNEWGVGPDDKVVSFIGHDYTYSRAHRVLQAAKACPDLKFVWCFEQGYAEVAKGVVSRLAKGGLFDESNIIISELLSHDSALAAISASDCFVSMSDPTVPFVSPYIYYAFGFGVPVVTSGGPASEEISEKLACKVTPGEGEVESISKKIKQALAGETDISLAKRFAEENFSTRACLEDLKQVLSSKKSLVKEVFESQEQRQNEIISSLISRTASDEGLVNLSQKASKDLNWGAS